MNEKTKQSKFMCDKCGEALMYCPCPDNPLNVKDIPYIEETEQKIYESETITPEEMDALQYNLYAEDIDGGLQNIRVSEEEMKRQREALEHAKTFIDLKESPSIPPYRTDQVHIKFTPEQLVVLIEALEAFSVNIEHTDYLYTEKQMGNLYEEQSYIRFLRDTVDDTLNEYVRHRPYSPFLPTWFKRIGKEDVDKEKDL